MTDRVSSEPLRQLGFLEDVHYAVASLDDLEDKIYYVLDGANRREIDKIRAEDRRL